MLQAIYNYSLHEDISVNRSILLSHGYSICICFSYAFPCVGGEEAGIRDGRFRKKIQIGTCDGACVLLGSGHGAQDNNCVHTDLLWCDTRCKSYLRCT